MNSSVWKSQEESRMENKSYFFGLIISRFLLFHFFVVVLAKVLVDG